VRAARPWLLALAAVAIAGTYPLAPGAATLPSIYVQYGDDCSVGITVDGGITVSPTTTPAVIPPGPYQVVLRAPENSAACAIEFQLSGPGVQLLFDFGGEGLNDQATETLLPGSTYMALDLNAPARTRAIFTTAANGSSSTLVGQSSSTATGHGEVATDLVGSARVPYRGTLAATLGIGGAVALRVRGKAVTSIRAGRYDLAVDDRTAKSGLALQKARRRAVAITSAVFVGRRTRRIALTPGTWLLYSSARRPVRLVVRA
jgi:hypothetical protein